MFWLFNPFYRPAGARQVAELSARVIHLTNLIQGKTMPTLDDVLSETRAQSGQIASLQTFVGGLETRLAEALANSGISTEAQAKIDAIFAETRANSQGISDAIDNDPNTPAAAGGDEGDQVR